MKDYLFKFYYFDRVEGLKEQFTTITTILTYSEPSIS